MTTTAPASTRTTLDVRTIAPRDRNPLIFGRFDACPIPRPETRAKFLDFKTKTDAR